MVVNEIVQIINANLKNYIKLNDIKVFCENSLLKYTFNISNCFFEIKYNYVDNFYQIRLEIIHHNAIKNTVLLTQSKKFKKDIKFMLKDLKLSKKSFKNHINGFTLLVSRILEKYDNLNFFEKTYSYDLKFDGIFI